jgi:hypothetical protein
LLNSLSEIEGVSKPAAISTRGIAKMYDPDYVKKLEREIEVNGNNRFEGWRLSSEDAKISEPEQTGRSAIPFKKRPRYEKVRVRFRRFLG